MLAQLSWQVFAMQAAGEAHEKLMRHSEAKVAVGPVSPGGRFTFRNEKISWKQYLSVDIHGSPVLPSNRGDKRALLLAGNRQYSTLVFCKNECVLEGK